jgi:hypothetical protein
MNAFKNYLTVMGEDAFDRGLGEYNPSGGRDTTVIGGQYIPNTELQANVNAIYSSPKNPGRKNAVPIAGLYKLGFVWYDENKKVYVYEGPDSSGLQENEAGYKSEEFKDVEQLLTVKSGGALNKFFRDDFNPNN